MAQSPNCKDESSSQVNRRPPPGAQKIWPALDKRAYWDRVARAAVFSPLQRTPLERLLGRSTLDHSPVFIGFDLEFKAPWRSR